MAHDRVSFLVGMRIMAIVPCVIRMRIMLLRIRIRISLAANVYNNIIYKLQLSENLASKAKNNSQTVYRERLLISSILRKLVKAAYTDV